MQECVDIARKLGRRVGVGLGIPVYLYEEAASRPDRKNLEDLRRGQYETLKTEIETNPDRVPDFGPSKVGPAGATVIGARHPLIAFNVYLASGDVEIAKKVAKAIRHSSGGLRYVKGLGLLVDGMAQVSMNLTNYQGTPLARVVETIRREARRYGVSVHHSELVGLIPQQALVEAARWYLQLDQFEEGQILEYRLAEAQAGAQSFTSSDFLQALADGTPTPGGGSAAAYSGAAAAALVAMVARLTTGKKKYTEVQDQMQAVLEKTESLREALTTAIQRDAAAFTGVMEAFRLPKNTPEEETRRQAAIEHATLEAARVPLEVATWSVEVIELARQVVELGNLNAISDGASGAALARAALTGAGYNVRINLASLEESGEAEAMRNELGELERRAGVPEEQIQKLLAERGGISPA